jgi:membrane associated rhomboid family serine protease
LFPLKDNIPTDKPAYVTYAIIIANVLVYFLWQKGGLHFTDPTGLHFQVNLFEHGLVPRNITHWSHPCRTFSDAGHICQAQPWTTPFTAMFMHAGLLHLGGNMLFLWIFGNNVEDSMGRVRFVAFYLLGGLAAFAVQIAAGPNSAVPNLGASGAIAAVLGGYILLYPRARVLTFIFIIFFFTLVELPATLVLGAWFLFQIFDVSQAHGNGGVAYFAHIGGFAFGLIVIKAFAKRVKQAPPRLPVW